MSSQITNFFNHPILDAYLKMNFITSLMPTTLIPLGILMAVYSTLSKQDVQRGGFQAMNLADPLITEYMGMFGIYELTALTLVPFAFLLGRDIFESVVKGYKKGEGVPSKEQKGGAVSWMDIPILDTFLKIQGNINITPATLVPLGILMVVYYVIRGKKPEEAQRGGMGLPSFLTGANLKEYMDIMNITTLSPQTLLPFALILSKELFERYVIQQKSLMKNVQGTVESAGETAYKGTKKVGETAYKGVKKFGETAYKGVKKVGQTAYKGVKKVGETAYKGSKRVGQRIKRSLD
jgi:hypothetical protein